MGETPPRWYYHATSLVNVETDDLNSHLESWAAVGWELLSASASDWAVGVSGGGTRYTMFWKWPLPRTDPAPENWPDAFDPGRELRSRAMATEAGLRYDGIYYRPSDTGEGMHGLVFKETGVVRGGLAASTTVEDLAQVIRMAGDKARFSYSQGELRFTFRPSHGTFDYRAQIGPDGTLTVNGEQYRFESF